MRGRRGRRDRCTQRRDGLGLVVLDRDRRVPGPERSHEHLRAEHDVGSVLAHQCVVAADPGLAFGAVQDQHAGLARARGCEFRRRGERRAAEAGNARCAEGRNQCVGFERLELPGRQQSWIARFPAVVLDDHARAGVLCRRHRQGFDRADATRDRRVQRRGKAGRVAGDHRAEHHVIPGCDDRHGCGAGALVEREAEDLGRRHVDDRAREGLPLVRCECEAGGEGAATRHVRHAARTARRNSGAAAGRSSMQSTGQGARHSSHPVHWSASTVCT